MSKCDLNEYKDKLTATIMEQAINQMSVEMDGDVYVDSEAIGPIVTQLIKDVLEEDEIKETIRMKIRAIIGSIDEVQIAEAIQPEISKGFLRRILGL